MTYSYVAGMVNGYGEVSSGIDLAALSDKALLASLKRLVAEERVRTVDVLRHLAEADRRRAYEPEAFPSLFSYCVRELGFSEEQAYRRIRVAREGRDYPVIFSMLERGEISLTVVALLAPHLGRENYSRLLKQAAGKTRREVERIISSLAPKPEPSDRVRYLGTRRAASQALTPASSEPSAQRMFLEAGGELVSKSGDAEIEIIDSRSAESGSAESGSAESRPADSRSAEGKPADSRSAESKPADSRSAESKPADSRSTEGKPADSRSAESKPADSRSAASGSAESGKSEAAAMNAHEQGLSQRVCLKFAADESLLVKLRRARELLFHKYPSGRLEFLVGQALEDLLEKRDPEHRLARLANRKRRARDRP
ncbi:MAG: hypothetical protein ABIJ96_17700 [Elusimicrobiota bacterium]